jgi:cellulose synthase/poly-beta-1,6-N-acetylglucosamine synthase-like glycosyltransferase
MIAPVDHLPSISVVVPTRGRADLVKRCIKSLIEQDYPPERYEVIVVEDGSQVAKAVVESLQSARTRVAYLGIPHSGAAAAYGVGLREARCDLVAFIDDDAMAPPTWLSQIASTLTQGKPQGVIGTGGRISGEYPLENFEASVSPTGELRWTGFGPVSSPPCEVDHLPGCNMAFWRDALLEIGGFDTRFSKTISWRHETDVCLRLRRQGYRLIYDPRLVVLHRAARWSSLLERVSPAVVWNMIRDDCYFRAKNFGWPGAMGAIRSSLQGIPQRLLHGTTIIFLSLVHLLAWIPGIVKGLAARRQAKDAPLNR